MKVKTVAAVTATTAAASPLAPTPRGLQPGAGRLIPCSSSILGCVKVWGERAQEVCCHCHLGVDPPLPVGMQVPLWLRSGSPLAALVSRRFRTVHVHPCRSQLPLYLDPVSVSSCPALSTVLRRQKDSRVLLIFLPCKFFGHILEIQLGQLIKF